MRRSGRAEAPALSGLEIAGIILTGLTVLYLVYRVRLAAAEPSSDDMLVEHFKRHGRYFPECEHGEWFCRGMRYLTEHGCYELTPEGWKLMDKAAPRNLDQQQDR